MFICQLCLNKAREKKNKRGVPSETCVCVGVIKGPVYQIHSSLENNEQKSKVLSKIWVWHVCTVCMVMRRVDFSFWEETNVLIICKGVCLGMKGSGTWRPLKRDACTAHTPNTVTWSWLELLKSDACTVHPPSTVMWSWLEPLKSEACTAHTPSTVTRNVLGFEEGAQKNWYTKWVFKPLNPSFFSSGTKNSVLSHSCD